MSGLLSTFSFLLLCFAYGETEDYCDRCGEFAMGRRRWMFHSSGMPRQEFFCNRCQRILRIYATIGLSLLTLLLGAFVGALWWLGAF